MRTRGGEADQHVARGHLAAVDDVALLHYAHAETREVVIAAVIHAGHLRGLAAHQRGARKLTAAATAGHHGGGARHQHRLPVTAGDLEQGAEAADASQHTRTLRARGDGFDAIDQAAACVDVHARVAITYGSFGRRAVAHDV